MHGIPALILLIPALALAATEGLLETPEEKSDMRGETTRVVDPYGSNAPNPLFLSSLTNKVWWNEKSEARLPILVTEPVGLTRLSQPVSVIQSFPAGTVPESIRVVTPYGTELPSQVRVADAGTRRFEVVFILSRLDAGAQMPLFVYYGSKPVQAPCPALPDPCLRIEDRPKGVAMINGRLQAELSKKATQDSYPILRVIKGLGMEFNLISIMPTDIYSEMPFDVPKGTPLRVLEDGPVRKTLSYGEWGENYTVSLYANSPLLFVASKSGSQSSGFWLPGGDTLNDMLCYESVEGLKRMPIQYTGGYGATPYTYEHLKEWYKEGWFALLDESQQQGVGWFFDLPQASISIQTTGYGYMGGIGAPGQSALYVARDARTEPCRQAYIAWKCPPLISRGEPQSFTKIEPGVPMLGRDFLRMHIETERFRPRNDASSAHDYVEEAQAFGGNYLVFQAGKTIMKPSEDQDGKPGASLFEELVRECHSRNMGFAYFQTGCNPTLIREIVRRGADGLWLFDEYGWSPQPGGYYPLNEEQRKKMLAGAWDGSFTSFSAADRADFKKRYGVDMPDTPVGEQKDLAELITGPADENQPLIKPPSDEKGAFANLSSTNMNDPSQRAMYRMLIDAHNQLMSDLAGVARENNSNVFVTATTSPNNLDNRNMHAYNDLEALADSFTSVTVDLYKNDPAWLNGMVKFARGAQGNRRPILIIGGYGGWDNRAAVENNLNFQVMFGANSLVYFALEHLNTPWPAMGAKDVYDMLDHTGLGAFAARAWPLEFVGILRNDRNYVQGLGFAFPANIITAKHLKQELAAPYKLIIVPNNPALSDANAAMLRDFAEAGGNLILEGATIRNKALSALARVSAVGDEKTGKVSLTGIKPPLSNWAADLDCSWQPFKAEAGVEVLATLADGQPAITMNATGKGKVICVGPRIGSCLLWNAAAEKIRLALRRLIEHSVGYLPIKIEPAGIPVWTTVLTDGDRVVIAAYNDGRTRNDVAFTMAGFTNPISSLVSIRTGRSYPVTNGKARNLALPGWKTEYFISSPMTPMPKTAMLTASPISQSIKPGMSFLNLRPLPSKQLQARLNSKQTNTIYVGVLDVRNTRKAQPAELGARALVAELGRLAQVKAEAIGDLQPETIGFYDVLVVPSLVEQFAQPRKWERNIRDFVEQGGRALLLGRSVGGYGNAVSATDLFPEIGKASELSTNKAAFQVTLDHPATSASAFQARFRNDLNNPTFADQYKMAAMKPGDRIESECPEHVTIQPGPAGMAVATTADGGEAVIVAGAFGQGRVVLSGMTLGCRRKTGDTSRTPCEEALSPGEQKVLINSVYWLGERPAPAAASKPAASPERSLLATPDKKTEDLLLQIE